MPSLPSWLRIHASLHHPIDPIDSFITGGLADNVPLYTPLHVWLRFVPTISQPLPEDDDKARTSAAAAAAAAIGEMMMLVLLIPLRCLGGSMHNGFFVRGLHGISHQMLSSRCYTPRVCSSAYRSIGLSVDFFACLSLYLYFSSPINTLRRIKQ